MAETKAICATSATESNKTDQESHQEAEPEKESPDNSEYDSAGSYSDAEPKIRSRGTDEGSDDETEVGLEREEGDGQESLPSRKVDDDEDKKNPQYIPKRGTFYEHDDRTAEDGETPEVVEAEKQDKDGKKKVWQDKKEKWSHDRFNDNEQAPKSKQELINTYGYDIRNEEGPPRARRRRRYGRGPNKYTRNWEDEDAYNKPPPPTRNLKKQVKPRRNREEFPPLRNEPENNNDRENERPRRYSDERIRTSQESNNGNAGIQSVQQKEYSPQEISPGKSNQARVGSGRVVKPKKDIKDSDYRGFTAKSRLVKTMSEQKPGPRVQKKGDYVHSQNFTNKNNNLNELEKDMGKLSVQEGGFKGKQRQGSVPPRMQNDQKQPGSKRYSQVRQQRSLTDNQTAGSNFSGTFYSSEFGQQGAQPANQQQILHPPQSQIHPVASQVPQGLQPPPSLGAIPPQVPVTAAPLLQPQFPPPFAPSPQFLQPGVPAPPFIPSMNYVQGQPPFPGNYQGFQQPFNPVTQPTELYHQSQSGITYYSTTDQHAPQRSILQKRPTAAIPIVAPPEKDGKKEEGLGESGSLPAEGEPQAVDVQE